MKSLRRAASTRRVPLSSMSPPVRTDHGRRPVGPTFRSSAATLVARPLQRVVGRPSPARLSFHERRTGGTHAGFLPHRIAIFGPDIVGKVGRCDIHCAGRNGHSLRSVEGLTEPNEDGSRQHGGVAFVGMRVRRDCRSSHKLDAKKIGTGPLFAAEDPCNL